MKEYQSLSILRKEWLDKAKRHEEHAEIYRDCAEQLSPFISAARTVIDAFKTGIKA